MTGDRPELSGTDWPRANRKSSANSLFAAISESSGSGLLLAIEGHTAAGGEHVDSKLRQRQSPFPSSTFSLRVPLQPFPADTDHLSGHTYFARGHVVVNPAQCQKLWASKPGCHQHRDGIHLIAFAVIVRRAKLRQECPELLDR
jgi:hypothetical protein